MIDLYTAGTPNGRKIVLMLEELGLPYKAHMIDMKNNEQKSPDFIAMNPNGRIPVIVDHEGPFGKKTTVFESGAILYYLAEKYDGQFLGHSLDEKAKTMQWVMFQMSGIGPNFGNYYYSLNYLEPKTPAYTARFEKESQRLLGVMELQLSQNEYLAGNNYSIADMCTYHWVSNFMNLVPDWFASKPSVRRWLSTLSERPAIKKASV